MGSTRFYPSCGQFPQFQNPIAQMQGVMSLRQASLQNQIGQQQLQAAQMENQVRAMDLQQQRLFMQALATPDGAPAPAASASDTAAPAASDSGTAAPAPGRPA